MGYFSNGTEGLIIRSSFATAVSTTFGQDCPVWLAHMLHNYKECNNEDSILHLLIPRKGITNGQCLMFLPRTKP